MLTVHLETPAGVKHHLLACGLLEAQGFQREGLTEGGRSRASQQLVLTNRYKSTLGFPQIHLPIQGTWVHSPGWEDPLVDEMAPHFSILAWKIPWTEKPGGL